MSGLLLATQVGTGFLHYLFPTRGSLMLDVVCVAMLAVIPVMGYGIQLAKQKRYQQHKTVMIILCAALFATVVAFEGDISFLKITKWREIAAASPYYESGWVKRCLIVHLCFSVPSLLLWVVLVTRALRNFDNPPVPNYHSRWHRRWGMIGAYFMTGTAVTGWIFYYLACVA